MTGTASSRGRIFHDFDSYKNQEWLRRRKLRIEQVRNQSKNIAKTLRQKVENEEKFKAKEFEEIQEAKFRCWRAEKLDEMERKLRCALEEFGLGHKLAEIEPFSNEAIEARDKVNTLKAQERGEIAKQEEFKRKKLEEEIKLSPIQRKKMTRKFENLRSALVCSISAQKRLLHTRESLDNCHPEPSAENFEKKLTVMKKKVKPVKEGENFESIHTKVTVKETKENKSLPSKNEPFCEESCEANNNTNDCNCKRNALSNFPFQNTEMIWINLNDVQNPSVTSCNKSQSSKANLNKQNEIGKNNGTVEFYDFQSRYHCKTFRDQQDLVEKIDSKSEDAIDLLQNEKEIEKLEAEKKQKAISSTEERGKEALRREKIKQSYNCMITQLEELNRKKNIMKSHQQISSAMIYMNDDRISERTKTRQRIMNSKFESIYYQAASELPPAEPRNEFQFEREFGNRIRPGEEVVVLGERESAHLKFSPPNLKANTPVTPIEEISPVGIPPGQRNEPDDNNDNDENIDDNNKKKKNKKKGKIKKKLLLDIDKALKEGRKLRETIANKWEEISNAGNDSLESGSDEGGPIQETEGKKAKNVQNQESQTENFNFVLEEREPRIEFLDFCAQVSRDSLTVSTASTSYKSPPSQLSCNGLHRFLECLESRDADVRSTDDSKLRRKMERVLGDLLCEIRSFDRDGRIIKGAESRVADSDPALKHYIRKLLNMSRERVANLSVSSDSNSSAPESDFPEKCESLRDGNSSEPIVQIWKTVLSKERSKESENETETDPIVENESVKGTDDFRFRSDSNRGRNRRFDLATAKRSKRIIELTDLLNKVRRDQEILLNETAEISKLGPRRRNRNESIGDCWDQIEGETIRGFNENPQKRSFALDNRRVAGSNSTLLTEEEEEEGEGEGDSLRDSEVSSGSTETFPDVMTELLRRKMISSPFKWCEGDFSNELTTITECPEIPSSIETAICNFRKKISRIKPFSSSASDSTEDKCDGDLSEEGRIRSGEKENGSEKSNLGESSTESINRALTSLGLNWAKSFLRKVEDSNAMGSSSCSDERKSTEGEESPRYGV